MAKVEHYCICGRKLNRKEFLALEKKGKLDDTVPRSDVIKGKTLTVHQLNRLVKVGLLKPIKYRSKTYLKKDEIARGLKYFEEPPKLF